VTSGTAGMAASNRHPAFIQRQAVTVSILNRLSTPDKPRGALIDEVPAYVARRWSLFPVVGKKPAVNSWKSYQAQPADEATLLRLLGKPGVTGLAVVTGRVSGGLAIRDFDQADAYHAWAARNPDDAASLPTSQTARGFHVYGLLDREVFVDLGDGELRADSKHYCLLPPSLHPDGPDYRWVNPLPRAGSLPALPASLTSSTQQPNNSSNTLHCVPLAAVDAIVETLPDGPGQRNRRVFELVRRLKGIAGLDTSAGMLRVIVMEWHRRALPVIRTKGFAETWSDFQIAWQRARVPYGTKARAAYEAARRAPWPLIDDCTDLGVLAAMCEHLSRADKVGRFYLGCRTVEDLFGVSRMTACRMFQALQFYGIIVCVENGMLRDRKATTWRFTGQGGRT